MNIQQELYEARKILGKFKALSQRRGIKHPDRVPATVEVCVIDLGRVSAAITLYEEEYGTIPTIAGATPKRRAS